MAIPLRGDFDASDLRAAARKTKDAARARRLLALAAVYDGASRTEAARIGGVTLQIVRDWVLRFNAEGPGGLVDRKAPGQPSRLDDAHRAALAAAVEDGPTSAIRGVARWRLVDLCRWLWEEFRVSVSKQTLSRELRAVGYRKLSDRPRHHAQAAGAVERFKKPSPPRWRKSRARRAPSPPRSRSGSPTRPGSGRRTRSPAAGPDAAAGPPRPPTSGPPRPTSSAPSAPGRARARPSCCPAATPRR
jgi:transposase